MATARARAKRQDASAGDNAAIDAPTVQRPEDLQLLDKAMTPNQPPPIESDTSAGRAADIERQQVVAEAVRLANNDVLPTLGGNTHDKAIAAAEAEG